MSPGRIAIVSQPDELSCVYLEEGMEQTGLCTLKKLFEAVTKKEVTDVYYEKQENLQYYAIDSRV